MTISKKDVEHVALLGRLELSEAEKEKYTEQLNNILDHAQMLNKLDTTNVQPTAHVLPLHNVFREDVVGQHIENERGLANAPAKEKGFFKVPKVL